MFSIALASCGCPMGARRSQQSVEHISRGQDQTCQNLTWNGLLGFLVPCMRTDRLSNQEWFLTSACLRSIHHTLSVEVTARCDRVSWCITNTSLIFIQIRYYFYLQFLIDARPALARYSSSGQGRPTPPSTTARFVSGAILHLGSGSVKVKSSTILLQVAPEPLTRQNFHAAILLPSEIYRHARYCQN
jgi:hypothetical protein